MMSTEFSMYNPFTGENDVYEQFSFFDIIQNTDKEYKKRQFESILNQILPVGSSDPHGKLRIYAWHQAQTPKERIIELLLKEYGTGGVGFMVDEKPFSVWYNQEGIRLNEGRTAKEGPIWFWEEIADVIKSLIQNGKYLQPEDVDKVLPNAMHELAQKLIFMQREITSEQYMQTIRDCTKSLSYQKAEEEIVRLLSDRSFDIELREELEVFQDAYLKNRDLLRFRRHKPLQAIEGLDYLLNTRLSFPTLNHSCIVPSFITDDEVETYLLSLSKSQKDEIHTYFKNVDEKKERIKFLRNVYGTGGSGCLIQSVDYGYKGISISRAYERDYDKIFLNWDIVVNLISDLIDQERYITQ